MGAACCVAAKDRTIRHGSSGEILHRNFRHSPTWSFRWDNRVGVVAGEENSIGWLSDVATRNDSIDLKSTTDISTHVSDGGSSLESYQLGSLRKSPLTQPAAKIQRTSGQLIASNTSLEVKQSTGSPKASDSNSVKPFSPVHSISSLPISPLSSQSHLLLPSPTPSQWASGSPGPHLAQQSLDSHSLGPNSPSMNSISGLGHGVPPPSNESTRVSYGRSSDGWSGYSFSELMSVSQREEWSFDSDSYSVDHDNSGFISADCQTCLICSKLLTEKSAWSSQKIMASNELSVVAVLTCGHMYHAECLETMTPEINKYDPGCPVCTFGEKQTLKISGKLLKTDRELKARNSKKSKNIFMDTNASFGLKNGANEGRSPKLSTSSSLKISSTKPFLRRHFSFGSRVNKSASENPPSKKKGLFWVKSSRE